MSKVLTRARKQSKVTTAPPKGRADATNMDAEQTDPAVIGFLRELGHPMKKEIESVRKLILSVSPEIREGIKWNAPSFRTTDYFATFHLRTQDSVRLILHMGAKTKATAKTGVKVADPEGLLEWLAKDRALVVLGGKKDIQARRSALKALLREWIRYV